ncbi:MAG: hypothetical protein GEU73_01790 [Chloroflexi bacterium]|nr:hypothetical protein [Chloroflexota bacterium]
MDGHDWADTSAGVSAPRHLVRQVDAELEGYLAASNDGLSAPEDRSPLITALVLVALLSFLRRRARQWVVARRPSSPRGQRPDLSSRGDN